MSAGIRTYGLSDKNTIVRIGKTPDGYGNFTNSETTVASKWQCRRTIPKVSSVEELVAQSQGLDTGDTRYFIGVYNEDIQKGDIIEESDGTRYEILKHEIKRDALGNKHHLKLATELL